MLAALPRDHGEESVGEIQRVRYQNRPDVYALASDYSGRYLGGSRLDPMWEELHKMKAVVFCQFPDLTWIIAYGGGCIPLLADLLEFLRPEPWVPNQRGIKKEEIKAQL